MPKISVIVPVYNVYDYLEKCLNSLVNQTDTDFEVIVVNDGSTDKSQEIIDKYSKKYSNIKSFIKENGGLSSARNFGLEKASGDYVLFLDSDDYYEPNTIEVLKQNVIDNDIVVFKMFIDSENYIKKAPLDASENVDGDLVKKYLVANPSACNKMIKKSLFDDNDISFLLNRYYEDLGTTPLLATKTNKIKFIDNNLYHYLKREDSIMNKSNYNKKIEDIFYVVDFVSHYFKNNGVYEKYKDEIEFIYIHHLLRAGGIRFLDYQRFDMVNKIRDIIKKDYPNFTKNKYFKKYSFKQKIMCRLLYNGNYNIIKLLRK